MTSADSEVRIETKEGQLAYMEALEFLRVQTPLKPFKWSDQLASAAKDHALDLSITLQTGVIGSDGSLPTDRIARYCNVSETWAESTVFGCTTATEVVESLIVNDGQPGVRGFRSTLFNKEDLKLVGISGSPHKTEDSSVLLTYAASILTTGQNEKINVTVTDKVPDEMMQKLKQMGIDPKRIKVIHDTDNTVTESRANRIFKPAAVQPQK